MCFKKTLLVSFILFFSLFKNVSANFFNNITDLIENNYESLRYGISVTDFNNDGNYEFIVAGFGSENLALTYKDNKLKNIAVDEKFTDRRSFTIGVAACDIDSDGYEEIYFLNTDTYSGEKKYSDRLIDTKNKKIFDIFEQKKNQSDLNFTAGRSVVCVDPTYQDLVRYASRVRSKIVRVPVDENLACDLEAVASAIKKDTRMVYLVNPNNPVPNIINKNKLRDFVIEVSKDRLVFIDEAYHEYVTDPDYSSMMDLIADGHNNIIITRTASKIHGLAGLTVGFGFAHPELIENIRELKTGKNNVLGIEAAYASYQDQYFQNFSRRKNRESLDIVEKMFDELGVRYIRSNTNFSFFETGIPVNELNKELLKYDIASGRPFPPFTKWSRVSMDRPEHMRYYVNVFKELFGERIKSLSS